MTFYARPSKTFFFNVLKKELTKIKGRKAFDAASANFKNRSFFRTDYYFGFDRDQPSLQTGLQKFPGDDKCVGILGDLRDMRNIPPGSMKAVVSTNTLDHLSKKEAVEVVFSLQRITEPGGTLVIQYTLGLLDEEEMEKIKNNFDKTKTLYYKNSISSLYERLFERKGNLGHHKIASSRLFLIISLLISSLEHLTCFFKLPNKQVLWIFSGKKGVLHNDFSLVNLKKIDDRLYAL